ncbi:MAG: hypothetical protein WC375_10690 [Methanomassiliicoccales archaeon]|jgi:hypothetical protein
MPLDDETKAAAGVTYGTLEWSKDQIKDVVIGFLNHKLAFVEDKDTIDLVRSQRKTPEWKLISEYVKDKTLRILAQLGLTLRKMEINQDDVTNLRNKIEELTAYRGCTSLKRFRTASSVPFSTQNHLRTSLKRTCPIKLRKC